MLILLFCHEAAAAFSRQLPLVLQHAGEQRQWATLAAFSTVQTRERQTAALSASALALPPLASLAVVVLSFHLESLRAKSNVIKTPLWDKRATERREGSCEHGSHLQPLGKTDELVSGMDERSVGFVFFPM